MSFLESDGVFQALRAAGTLTVDLRVLRLVSSKCRELYNTYMIPETCERPQVLSDHALGYYTFLHILGRRLPLAMVRITVTYLLRDQEGPTCRKNPYIRLIVPLGTIPGAINIDNLVRLYGLEAITREILSQDLYFGCPELLHTYVPRILGLLPHPQVILSQMLRRTLLDPDAAPLAPTVLYWLRDHHDPEIAQITYWKAISSHLARKKYDQVSGVNSGNIRTLFSEIPQTWTLPEYLWRENGWLILALDSTFDGPLMQNLRVRGEYREFMLLARRVMVKQHLYKIIPHLFRRYFDTHESL